MSERRYDLGAEIRDIHATFGIRRQDIEKHPALREELAFLDAVDLMFHVQEAAGKLVDVYMSHAPRPLSAKHDYLVQCLFRGTRQSFAILRLIDARDLPDASIIIRSLMERALLLVHLCDTDEFEVFRDWTKIESYRHKETYVRYEGGKGFITKVDREEYKRLASDPRIVNWRCKPADVAKRHGMTKIYDAVYDYGSAHVHPRFGEGWYDYDVLMKRQTPEAEEMRVVLLKQAVQSFLLLVSSAALRGSKSIKGYVVDELNALTAWLSKGRPTNMEGIHQSFLGEPGTDLINFPPAP